MGGEGGSGVASLVIVALISHKITRREGIRLNRRADGEGEGEHTR